VPVIDQLAPALKHVDTQILPALDKASPESKHAVYEMVGPFFQEFGEMSAGFDRNGYMIRLLGNGSANAVDAGVPCRLNFAGAELARCESVLQLLGQYLTPPGTSSTAARRMTGAPSLLGGPK
jgi:hypothetical protein